MYRNATFYTSLCKKLKKSQVCSLLPSSVFFVAGPTKNGTALDLSDVSSSQVPRDNGCSKISVRAFCDGKSLALESSY